MFTDELIGPQGEPAFASLAIMEAYVTDNRAEKMVPILELVKVEEVIKGLVYTLGLFGSVITNKELGDASAFYIHLRKSIERDDTEATAEENALLKLLEASQEETSAHFFMTLYSLPDKVEIMGMLCAVIKTIINKPISQLSNPALGAQPALMLHWVSSIVSDTYFRQN